MLQLGKMPGTAWLMLALAVIAAGIDAVRGWREAARAARARTRRREHARGAGRDLRGGVVGGPRQLDLVLQSVLSRWPS